MINTVIQECNCLLGYEESLSQDASLKAKIQYKLGAILDDTVYQKITVIRTNAMLKSMRIMRKIERENRLIENDENQELLLLNLITNLA